MGGVYEAPAQDDFRCMQCRVFVRKGATRIGVANEANILHGFDQFCGMCGPSSRHIGSPAIGIERSRGRRCQSCTCCTCVCICGASQQQGDGSTAGQPSFAGAPAPWPQPYPASLQPVLDPCDDGEDGEDDEDEGGGEGAEDSEMFNMRTSRDAILRVVVKPLLADLPMPSADGRFTTGNNRGLATQRTAKGFLRSYPHAPMCSSREGIEQRAAAAIDRSKAEAMTVFATSHVTMAVFVHEVVSREELQGLEAFQASTQCVSVVTV